MRSARFVFGLAVAALLVLAAPAVAPASSGTPPPARLPAGLDPSKAVTQYAADAWGLDDGLPQSTVESIARTTDGHLWLGTQEGLARFDGVRFRTVDAHDGLPHPTVLTLAADTRAPGALWVGTRDGGLVHLDRDLRVTQYSEDAGLVGGTVAAMIVDRAGRVWAGTREGLCMLDPSTSSPHFQCMTAGLDDPYVRRMAAGRDGSLWLGTRAGLYRYHGGRITSLAGLGGMAAEPVTALREDRAGGLWVGTLAGLGYVRGGALQDVPATALFDGLEVSAILQDRAGSVWVGTYGEGLVRLHDGEAAPALTTAGRADVKTVRALFQDPEGSLWVGTLGGGLARLRDGRFTPFGAAEGLGADIAFAVAPDPRGGVWVGTTEGGAAHIVGGRVTQRVTTADGLPSDAVSTILPTRDGAVWIGLNGAGLCRWADEQATCFTEADGLPDPFVLSLFEDRAGTLWVGSDAGLSRWTGAGFAPPDVADAPQAPIVSLAQTPDGALWAGSFGDGLFYMAHGRTTHYPEAAGAVVLALHAQADGTLWAGSEGEGLTRIRREGPHFIAHHFTTREGLLSDAVLQVLEDRHGALWLTSNRGIAQVALADLDRVVRGGARSVQPIVYGRADGLRSAEANGGGQPAGAVATDGSVWVPTVGGVATIQPASILTNPVVPPVAVQRLVVDERAVPLADGGVVLPAGSRELRFEYAGLSFNAPARVQHRYRLDGRDDDWTMAGERRAAFYTDLAPGHYVFRVEAANDDGVWNDTGATVAFTLKPHFWQTGWFTVFCVVALGGLAFAAYRTRTRQLEARAAHLEKVVDERTHELRESMEEVQAQKSVIEEQAQTLVRLDEAKTAFFSNISHEFRTPLTLTIGPLENALGEAYGPVGGPLRRQMAMMLRNARRLLRLINQLLDVSKLESGKMDLKARRGDLRTLLDMVVRSFEGFAEEHGQALTLEAPAPVALHFEADKLEKVFFNLLSNAIKYTPAGGSITVGVEERVADEQYPEGAAVVRVTDTGAGIDAAALPYIFDRFHQAEGAQSSVQASTGIGLSLVQELVALHGGTVTVESRKAGESDAPSGSTFTVTLPLGIAHLSPASIEGGDVPEAATADAMDARLELAKVETDYRDRQTDRPANYEGDATFTGDGMAGPHPGAELVLLVEDNPDVRAYVRDCLADRYRIAEAGDGEAGLEAARRLRPDLILSDVMMPKMDGYTMCRHVKEDAEIGHTPLILLTAKADEEQRVEGLELGADDYMAKPFNARELRARVHNTLTIKRQERELAEMNADLQAKVREQLGELIRKSRLQKYFPQKLVRQILEQEGDVTVSAERKRVTVVFSDLTGFTHLSDTNPPEVVTQLLNEYLNEMVALIEAHGGTLDKFMGDGLMVLFGAADETPPDQQAARAVAMALAMQESLAELRTRWEANGLTHRVELRIGINQDEVTVGNFGSDDLVEYTAIGQGVNLASRLEGACAPGHVLVSFPVFALTKEGFNYGGPEVHTLKGIAEPVPAFSLDATVSEPVTH